MDQWTQHCPDHSGLEQQMRSVAADVSEIKRDVKTLAGRPSWAVTAIISLLSTAVVALLILYLEKGVSP
jgi:hypothetical protein